MASKTAEPRQLTVEEALAMLPEEQRKLFGQPLPTDFDIDDVFTDVEVEAMSAEGIQRWKAKQSLFPPMSRD